jgi:hypothetical protein
VNKPCSDLHSFRATGVSSGLATRVTLTHHGGGWKSLLHRGGPTSNFIFVRQYVIVFGFSFKWCTLYVHCTDVMAQGRDCDSVPGSVVVALLF